MYIANPPRLTSQPLQVPSHSRAADEASNEPANGLFKPIGCPALPGAVYALGLTSLLTDMSSEMVTTVMPLYLSTALQLSPMAVGLYDGAYHGAAAVARLAAARWSDARNAHKQVASWGYALSALAKVFLLIASFGTFGIAAATLMDRLGKGVRTAPRDALIARFAPPDGLGLAFGVHRRMDSAGAMLGPLAAAGLLWWWPDGFIALFCSSAVLAATGWCVLMRGVPAADPAESRVQPTPPNVQTDRSDITWRNKPLVKACLGIFLVNAVSVSDGMLYLGLQTATGFDAFYMPLMFVLAAGVFMLLAKPAGRWADRVGLLPVIGLGFAAMGLATGAVALGLVASMWSLIPLLILVGLHYACTDGMMAMWAIRSSQPAQQTTALAWVATAAGLGKLVSSATFGAIWQNYGLNAAAATSSAALLAALPLAWLLVKVASKKSLARGAA